MNKPICYNCKNMSCIYENKTNYSVRCYLCSNTISLDKEQIGFVCNDFKPSKKCIKENKTRLKEIKKCLKNKIYIKE